MNVTQKSPHKKAVWQVIRCVCFIMVFLIGLSALSMVCMPKSNNPKSGMKQYQARGFYGQPKDSLDIIGIGNSNLLSSFSLMELWGRYGYTGYTCGEAGQTIFQAYTVLQEVLSCQKPKVVVLEGDGIFQGDGLEGTFSQLGSSILGRVFPVVYYHNRWKSLSIADFTQPAHYTWTDINRGYLPSKLEDSVNWKHRPKANSPTDDRFDPFITFELDAFRNLCARNGARLVLVYVPTAFSWDQQRDKVLARYAAANGLPFLDMNEPDSGLPINWKTDSKDGGVHLNYFGALKVTLYIGAYLNSHYCLPDHRNDPAFHQWGADYAVYEKAMDKINDSIHPSKVVAAKHR
ncbi:MAG: SGNH/GDSL hydrolase family protein [Clostridia bacterium]|nr:SGNH/GDSL hydrolase family protein [Clostridia bacterium]